VACVRELCSQQQVSASAPPKESALEPQAALQPALPPGQQEVALKELESVLRLAAV
jgi:hypothetical protein